MIFESHAHYDDEKFDEDRDELLESFKENGIGTVANISSSLKSIEKTMELTQKYSFIYGAVGVHPEECGTLDEEKFSWVEKMARLDKVVAIGEIGLDYYWNEPDRSIQKKWFERQMELARELKLPMVIHSRDAAKDTLDMMRAAKAQDMGGVIHCFSYGKEIARDYLNMGYYFGIGGIITFKNAKKLKEVVDYIPMDSILIETDSPYLSPDPNRGKRNSSINLIYVAQEIGRIKGIDYEKVIEITEKNAKEMYGIN